MLAVDSRRKKRI